MSHILTINILPNDAHFRHEFDFSQSVQFFCVFIDGGCVVYISVQERYDILSKGSCPANHEQIRLMIG